LAYFPPNWPDRCARRLRERYRPEQVRAALAATDPNRTAPLADPVRCFTAAGLTPDPWQAQFLSDPSKRLTLLCCRRAGKSFAAAAKTLAHCSTTANALALVFSPTLRQSVEFARYVRDLDKALGSPVKRARESLTQIEWANGARLMSLPDNQRGVVGFTPTLVVIDEASRVSDDLYKSVRPMLALGASLVALSTPFGKRGWFFDLWDTPARLGRFKHWRVTADHCPRISPAFLAEERAELGERWFRQEWYCSFEDAVDAVFAKSVIDAARSDDEPLLFDVGA
jgi:hypothetical protein